MDKRFSVMNGVDIEFTNHGTFFHFYGVPVNMRSVLGNRGFMVNDAFATWDRDRRRDINEGKPLMNVTGEIKNEVAS